MQTKLFVLAAIFSAASMVAGQSSSSGSTSSPPTASQTSKAMADVASYISSVTADSAFSSQNAAIKSAVPSMDLVSAALNASAIVGTGAVTPAVSLPGYTALPSSQQSYIASVASAASGIASKDLSGAAPQATGMVVAAGAAAAGVLGFAAML